MVIRNNNTSEFFHNFQAKKELLGKIQFNITNKNEKIVNIEEKHTKLTNDVYNVPEIRVDKSSIQNFILTSIPRFKTPLFGLKNENIEIVNSEDIKDDEFDNNPQEQNEYLPTIFVDNDEQYSNDDIANEMSISSDSEYNINSVDLTQSQSPVSVRSSHSSEIISFEENSTANVVFVQNIDSCDEILRRLKSYNDKYINGKIEDIVNQNISMKDKAFLLHALEKQQTKYIPSKRKVLITTRRKK